MIPPAVPATINPGPRPAARKPQGWSDYDLLTRRPQDERVAIGSALLITILFHGALLLAIPWSSARPVRQPPPTQVEYTLEPLTPEEQMRYMQTNPNAPESPPIETPNISSRNQRAAQPDPNPQEKSDVPRTQGEIEDSSTIISGSPDSPPPTPAPSPPSPPAQPATPPTPPPTPAETPETTPAQPVAAAPPLPALEGLTGTGEGINLAEKPVESTAEKPPENPSENPPTPETQAEPAAQAAPPTPPTEPTPPAQPPASANPMPARQRVQVELPPGMLVKSVTSAGNMGQEAANAKFREFGGYLEGMFEAIGSAWRLACQRHTFATQDYGSRVVVIFSINAKGEVVALQVTNSTSTQSATLLCVNAIQSRAPFGPWTKEMVAQLNEHEEIRITFWYR